MSAHKSKNTAKKPPEAMEPPAPPRVVAIPKTPEPAAKKEQIGDILRSARLERGDDIEQIAEYLRIKPAYLVALENSHYDALPADAYVIGFIRTYANFLGVSGKEAVDRYRYEMAGRRNKPTLVMPIPMSEGPAPSGLILAGAVIVVLLIYALWYGISSSGRTEVSVPPPLPTTAQPVPPTSSAAPASDLNAAAGLTSPVSSKTSAQSSATALVMPPAAPGIVVTAEQPPSSANKMDFPPQDVIAETKPTKETPKDTKDVKDTKAAADAKETKATETKDAKDAKDNKDGKQIYGDPNTPARIIIRASQSSWVMITDESGKAIFDHVLKTGDVYKVPNKKGLSLTTGNGNGITLSLDGSDLPKVATGAPHVVRNISLDPEQLIADPASATEH